jgi:hypothetical protein
MAAGLPQALTETVVTGVVRLDLSTHRVLGEAAWQDTQVPMDVDAAAQRISASRLRFTPPGWQVPADRLLRREEFWVLWVPSPSPTADFEGRRSYRRAQAGWCTPPRPCGRAAITCAQEPG